SYKSGKTDDVDTVVKYLIQEGYQKIFLVGFSLGGNIMFKYAGEKGSGIDSLIRAVVGISVPCDLAASARQLAKPISYFYLRRLLDQLKQKAIAKKVRFPEAPFSASQIKACTDFESFDDLYTAPAHGYKDAADYYAQCSSNQFIPFIKIPALLITAKDDPFLSGSCYPLEEAASNTNFQIEMPAYGGHVGFAGTNLNAPLYSEVKVVEFFVAQVSKN
ncbi:MAG: alpha/beta fold hydrolase, partial [Bacteroidetes bacterium]|nr:alpha/beta fold hydrolase [Bacteroidota bacterium]